MKRWETWARLDVGDHGMGVQRDDPTRVGLVELTDALRWVPREGEDWSVPLRDVTVRTREEAVDESLRKVLDKLAELGHLKDG